MKIGHLYINPSEVSRFSVEKLSSVDIRAYIYFKNGGFDWVRTNEDEILELSNRIE